jgi:hypothetical protein
MAIATRRIDLGVMRASSPGVELETGRGVAELQTDPAAAELRTDPAVELVPAIDPAAVLALAIDPAAVLARAIDRVVVLARLIVRGVAEPQTGPAVAGRGRGQVAVELQTGQAVGELQHVPVVAVPVLGHRHAQPEARRRTRSVIVPHHRGLVPHLVAGEALVVVAETTREPAATEVVVAWAVAE